jgi:flagellar basal-body rod protein FlgB
MIRLFDGAIEHLSRGLTFASRRHELIAQNLANVETPGYHARDLVFEDHLTPLVGAVPADLSADAPLAGPAERRPRIVFSEDRAPNTEGNDVKLDRQMARLAENTLYHNALVQILSSQFNMLKQAISGRG